jgi:hypothetical protein
MLDEAYCKRCGGIHDKTGWDTHRRDILKDLILWQDDIDLDYETMSRVRKKNTELAYTARQLFVFNK